MLEVFTLGFTVAGQQARDSELVGYVVIGVFSDGASSVGFGWDKLCPIPQSLAPQWIAELLRRDMITAPEIADTVNRANGFED